MQSDRDKNFDKQLNQLITLLKKLIKTPSAHDDISKSFFSKSKDSAIQLNISFFNFFPLASEEWEELEDWCEQHLSQEEGSADISSQLTVSDLEFLRRNGIQF